MPSMCQARDDVEVGQRCVRTPSAPNAMWLWVVGDQLRKGAASNAVQIGLAAPLQRPGGDSAWGLLFRSSGGHLPGGRREILCTCGVKDSRSEAGGPMMLWQLYLPMGRKPAPLLDRRPFGVGRIRGRLPSRSGEKDAIAACGESYPLSRLFQPLRQRLSCDVVHRSGRRA